MVAPAPAPPRLASGVEPPVPLAPPERELLEAEARLFARYLLGGAPPPELIERYLAANAARLDGAGVGADRLLGVCRAHPWTLSLLDAGAALLQPDGLLRRKLLIMAAVLETSPSFGAAFLPASGSVAAGLPLLAWVGLKAVARSLLGVLLVAALRGWP